MSDIVGCRVLATEPSGAVTTNEMRQIMNFHRDLYLDIGEGENADLEDDQRPHVYTLRSRSDLDIEWVVQED